MLRSMFSAISGLRSHQVYLDIIGNNIANVNTTGFKANRATFAETLWQTTRVASAPNDARGGLNPVQVGLGTTLSGSDAVFTQGDLRSTGKTSDLAIQGNGFFVLENGNRQFYTRDGALDVGTDGTLQSLTCGLRVLGWSVDSTSGVIDTTRPVGAITIPVGGRVPAEMTANAAFTGNLDSRLATGETVQTTLEVYDSLGQAHTVDLTFTKAAGTNTWDWAAAATGDTAVGSIAPASGQVTFDSNGVLATGGAPSVAIAYTAASGLTSPQPIAVDFSRITQVAEAGQIDPFSRDGAPPGTFVSFGIDAAGIVTAVYSNGKMEDVGQVALADFKNPSGLMRGGNNLFEASANSGDPLLSTAGANGLGQVNAGFLEMSNVDLAQQFTNMILASRGFQANSRVITASDELLQEVVNLRR